MTQEDLREDPNGSIYAMSNAFNYPIMCTVSDSQETTEALFEDLLTKHGVNVIDLYFRKHYSPKRYTCKACDGNKTVYYRAMGEDCEAPCDFCKEVYNAEA